MTEAFRFWHTTNNSSSFLRRQQESVPRSSGSPWGCPNIIDFSQQLFTTYYVLGVVNNPTTKCTQEVCFKIHSLISREEKASSLLCSVQTQNLNQVESHAWESHHACLSSLPLWSGGLSKGASGGKGLEAILPLKAPLSSGFAMVILFIASFLPVSHFPVSFLYWSLSPQLHPTVYGCVWAWTGEPKYFHQYSETMV